MNEFCVLGVDLVGVPHRPTGMCVLQGLRASTFLSYSDTEIFKCAAKENPSAKTLHKECYVESLKDEFGKEYTGFIYRP
ncbi:MAG: hypothetical protein V3V48_12985 [Candidatus Aminicenantaceae bacterium]|jgi:hypothetical protein